jgi:hypothetical protein
MKLISNESGLSVVFGALLLIMVVVASISALALMTSQTQKKQIEQKSLRDAVQSENLTILSLGFDESDSGRYWNTIILNVVNLNTVDSRVVGVNINDTPAANYTDIYGRVYNSQKQFPVPAAKSTQIFLDNFTPPPNKFKNQSIRVILFTSLTNQFEHVFLPPVPIIKVNVDSEQIGTQFQDVLSLDGSDSLDREGTIINYEWLVGNYSTNGTNSTNSTSILGKLQGQKATMTTPFNLTTTGQFWVNLNVTDSNGMLGSTTWNSP